MSVSTDEPSAGRRFVTVGFLVLLMFVPLFFAAEVIQSRKQYSAQSLESVAREWGGAQEISGPQMVIPVEETVTRLSTRPRTDPVSGVVLVDRKTGEELVERFEETVTQRANPVFLYPERFEVRIGSETQVRSRGIFRVPVYQAQAVMGFDFDVAAAEKVLGQGQRLLWDEAELRLGVANNRALRGVARLETGGRDVALEPRVGQQGVRAALGDPRGAGAFQLTLGFNGAQSLFIVPVGRTSHVEIESDWPHPSFAGAFLPDRSEIGEDGFLASWTIPHLARALPQVSREDPEPQARRSSGFGVRYLEPNDFYQKAYRAARYGVLFIALTFLTILLIERGTGRATHSVQYILVGLVQTVFVLLMVSYAEHIGFGAAYLVSAGAVIALLTIFGAVALKLGTRTWGLGGALFLVYGVLYLILRSADYALLAGSTLAFLALALTMLVTRNEDWHGPEREKRPSLWSRRAGRSLAATGPAKPAPEMPQP